MSARLAGDRNEQLGVQVTPGTNARDIIALGERFGGQVDRIWLQDQVLARNVYVMLGVLADRGCGVGTNVTWPFARNPIEMASAAATITELLAPGRTLTIGMGSGGALVASLFDMSKRTAIVQEAMLLMRQLWTGVEVELDHYPLLGRRLGYLAGAKAQLTYPVPNPPDIVLAGLGPQIIDLTAKHADGSISASNLPVNSRAAMESTDYESLCNAGPLRERCERDPSFRRHFGMNVSVAADRDAARAHARRQVALIVGNPGMWNAMEVVGLDVESGRAVKAAFDAGAGIEGASQQVSASSIDALIIAGTPDDVIERLANLHQLALGHGYTDFFLGAPLGPDPHEAADLLSSIVIPAVWPERRPR